MRKSRFFQLAAGVLSAAAWVGAQAPPADELLQAVRKGDVAGVKAALERGADVNTKFRYGKTALFDAAAKGHVEVVKALIEAGADVNVADTFYQATALTWASEKGHTEVTRLLLAKGAKGKEMVLVRAVRAGRREMVQAVLDVGELPTETLTAALDSATKNNQPEIAEMLRKVGAKPPAAAEYKVEVETLQKYAGTYRNPQGTDITFGVKEGKLKGGPAGQEFTLAPTAKDAFRLEDVEGIALVFQWEGERVVSVVVKQPGGESTFKRAEVKP